MQPTDVNENKELPPSSDFLSPLSTGKPVGRGTSKAGNTTVAETGRRKKKIGNADAEVFRRWWLRPRGVNARGKGEWMEGRENFVAFIQTRP